MTPLTLDSKPAPVKLEKASDLPTASEFFREGNEFDIRFEVPQIQRLRFTDDVFQGDFGVLATLIEPSGPMAAKVQIWVDGALELPQGARLTELHARLDGEKHIDVVGEIQYVTGGEGAKRDPRLIESMLAAFNQANLDRRSYVLVIGGGAVLDAVGYAAATAHRGLRLIRIPTTTLAQGDSGVGVKNAINYFEKKNWLGTFATPWAVINDAKILETLPDRDFRCGFSEAVKVSLLKSADQFETLVRNAIKIRERDHQVTQQALKHSILLHLQHITRGGDPFEAEVARPLDFGHWSAHKLEPMSAYALRHGEAVAIGVSLDCLYSSRVYNLSREDAHRVVRCLAEIGLPTSHSLLANKTALFDGLEEFRQHLGGELTITMIDQPGSPLDVHEVNHAEMGAAIDELIEISRGENAIGREFK
jgi:3-dehydroquinate synthase